MDGPPRLEPFDLLPQVPAAFLLRSPILIVRHSFPMNSRKYLARA